MLKFIVVCTGGVYHLCYQVPGTSTFHSYETYTSERLAIERANDKNRELDEFLAALAIKGRGLE
jgi:hypothetical protein